MAKVSYTDKRLTYCCVFPRYWGRQQVARVSNYGVRLAIVRCDRKGFVGPSVLAVTKFDV